MKGQKKGQVQVQVQAISGGFQEIEAKMLGQDIKNFIENFPCLLSHFQGVFPSDKVPILKNNTCCVVNTDNSAGQGKNINIYLSILIK